MKRSVDCLMRLHQAREVDRRRGRRLGPNDYLMTWEKPSQHPPGVSPEDFAALPATLTLRLLTLEVSARGRLYPAEALGELYMQRWGVELHFREIKISLGLDVLRCLSPEMIHKELLMHISARRWITVRVSRASSPC